MKANRTLTDRGHSALKKMHFALPMLKILSSLLALILCISCLPSQVFAQVGSESESQTAGLSDDPAATAADPSSGNQGTPDDSANTPASTAGGQEALNNSASNPGFSDANQQAPENTAGGSDAGVSPSENASVGASAAVSTSAAESTSATESAGATVGASAAAGARTVAGASTTIEAGAFAEASTVAGDESIVGIMPLSIGDCWDLSNYITGIVVRDSAGSTITNGNFFYNEPYSFTISFAEHEKTGGQFAYKSGKLVYQLPKELVVSSPQSGFIKVANGSSIGEYSIGSDGLVQLFFYDVDNQGNAIGQNFIDYYVNVKFSLGLQAEFASDLTAEKIDFGANSSITVNSINSQAAALQVAKTASVYNSASESVSFTVEVRAVGGQVSNVVLADSLSFSIQNAFKIKSSDIPSNYANPFSSGSGSFEYSINGGAWVSQALPQWESGGQRLLFDFGTTGGITLQSNETVQLRYTVSLSDILDYFASQTLPGPGDPGSWIQRYLYNLTLNNTATASGRDGGTELTSTSTTQTPLRKTLLSKSGTEQADGQIQWTAKVGDGSGDGSLVLNGLTINDSMSGGLSQSISGDLTIKLYGLNNNLLSTVTVIAPYTGTAGFALDGSSGFSYTVPASPANIGRVDFVYYTTPSDLSPNGIYRNEIGITVNGQTSSVSSSVSYSGLGTGVGTPENGFNIRYSKSSQWLFDSAGKPSDLIYTIVMRVPAGTDLIDSAAGVFQDVFMSYESGDGNYPYLHKDWRITGGAEVNINNLVNVTVSGEANPDYCVYLPATGSGADMRVYLGVSSVPSVVENYRWPYSEAKTVTITYRVPLDIPDLAGTTTLLEYLQSTPNARLRNQIISTGNGVEDVVVASCYDSYPMYKSVEPNYFMSSLFDYSVTLNGYTNVGQQSLYDLASGNQGYKLFTAGQAAIFTDTFDPKLSYVPGSLKVSDGTNYYGPYEMNGVYVQDWLAGQIVGNSFTVDFRDFVQVDGALSTIIDASPGDWYADSIEYTVYYQLLLKDQYTESYPDPAGPPLAVQNTATVFGSSEHFSGGVFTDSAEAFYTPQVVHKEMSTNNGDNTADVEIIINPDGKRLRPVSVADPLLTATDSMQGSLGFFLSSIRIETQSLVAGAWDGVWIAAPTPIAVGALWSFSPHDAQTVDFYIPDEQPVRITYTAAITEYYWGQPTDFSNSITVSGYSSSVTFDDYVISRSSAYADANSDRSEVTLYKTDSADPSRLLTGAHYALYLENEYGWPYGRIPTDPSIPAVIEVPDTYSVLYYLDDQVIGPSGYIRFSDPWLTYSYNCTFVLIELEAPPGYQLPATLADRMSLFSFRASSPIGDKEFTVILDYLVLTNDRIAPIDIQIPIEKIVTNQPTATETFTFRLAEVTDATGDIYSSPFVGAVQTINGSGSAAFTIEQLGVGTYYFKITEDNDGLAGWTYDSTAYIVKVEVFNDASNGDGLDYSLEVLNSNLSEVAFSNAYSSTFEQDLGSLTVTKSLSDERPGSITNATAFNFKVLDTVSGNYLLFNTAGVCTGTNSIGTTLSVSVNTPAVLTGIPAGLSVRVEELATSGQVAGWTKTVSYAPAAEVVVVTGGQHEVVITNSYNFNSGSLTIFKALSATRPGAITDATPFSVRIYEVMSGNYLLFDASGNYTGTDSLGTTLSVSVDTPVAVTGIPAGWQVAVEEVSTSGDVAGWTKTVSYLPAAEVDVLTGGQHEVAITNSYSFNSGSLTVSKALSATRPGAITDATPFSVRIYEVMSGNYLLFDASGNYTGTDSLGTTLSVSVDTPVAVTGIPAGWQVAVEEVSTSGVVAGWTKTVSYTPAAEVVVLTGGQHEVVVTNSYALRPDDPVPDDPDPVDPDPDDPVSDDPQPIDPEPRGPNTRSNNSNRGSIPGTGDTTVQLIWIMLALAFLATPLMYEGRRRQGIGKRAVTHKHQ